MAAEGRWGLGGQIFVAAVVALLVGGSAPWWWGALVGGDEGHPPGGHEEPMPGEPGRMEVRCSANPHMVAPGEETELVVQVTGRENSPVIGANVRISVGGGIFPVTGSRTALGETDAGGSYRTMWRAPHEAAESYGIEVMVAAPGGDEEHTTCEVMIRR